MKIVNHVMSQDIHSNILTSFIEYLSKSDPEDQHITSVDPIEDADIYHYHRPHLEKKLMSNSVVTVHHDLMENDPWLSLPKFLKVYRDASAVVCLNNIQKEILSKHNIDHTFVIPHGYNKDIFCDSLEKIKKDKITLGLISKRYGRRVKGEAYFLELIKRLDNQRFDFILVGDGRSEEYFLLKEYGFDVKVYESLPYRVFQSLYQNIDILLMLSCFEGGPANVPEAIVSSTPIAGFPIGMIPDFVKDMVNGVILSGDAEEDTDKLMELALNRNEFEKLLENTKLYANTAPTWEAVAEMYNEVYNDMVAR
ncbi:glycosyltransferase family 4 protein [Vibrio alginolyticus]|nr:glycosyltransferase family 4 protein [Vibrio alginolyticus]MBS9989409.1 glycosyltransferase family 4 protein [Vibrio alginolyticus]MBT0076860.1 glycosyltransferase family 4 protein [Vibrio alginolyticus]HCZ9550717.1 glycosyltransferase family 4 protein [Vibrio alginolyticus]